MQRVSIIIGGFGAAGAALALALTAAGVPANQIVIADPAAHAPVSGLDTRIMALNPASLRFLRTIGVGQALEAGYPLRSIALTDSSLEAIVRPLLLGFSADEGGPLALMLPLSALQAALRAEVQARGIAVRAVALSNLQVDATTGVTLSCGAEEFQAALVVAADGARSSLRQGAGISVVGWGYDQVAISAIIRHSRPHGGEAVQHFLPNGTFALLPLDEGRSSLVWSEKAGERHALAGADDADLLEAISRRAAGWRGEILGIDAISRHPLNLQLARRFHAPRLALLADAVHVVHPLAGQGLNLGLMDAECLAALIADRLQLGLDPGAPDMLEAYQAERRPPAVAMASATDALNRLFSNDSTPLRLIRDFGLGLVERSERLKSALRRVAGG